MARERGRPAWGDVLTPAEWRVAEAVRHGLSNPAIAARLGVSVDAVKFHMGNVLGKLGFASRAELRVWDGVRRDSGLFRQERAMGEGLALGALGQIGRSVEDIAAATAWYRDVLGLPLLYAFGDLAFFDCGGIRLMLSRGQGAAESILYFRVEDIRAAHASLGARGVVFLNAPHLVHRHGDGTEEWMAFFEDQERRPMAIMAQVGGGVARG
jgi:DNA-binding CsgD family transcriptional regulator/catechol 2,3-dioxygenase-like lactoylglutathione lyase family enzyme